MISPENLCDHDKYVGYCKACQIQTFKLSKDPHVWLPDDIWFIIMKNLPNQYSFEISLFRRNKRCDSYDHVFFSENCITTEIKALRIVSGFTSPVEVIIDYPCYGEHFYRMFFVGSELSFYGYLSNMMIFGNRMFLKEPDFYRLCNTIPKSLGLDIDKFKKFIFFDREKLKGLEDKSVLIVRISEYVESAKFYIHLSELNEFKIGWQQYEKTLLQYPENVDPNGFRRGSELNESGNYEYHLKYIHRIPDRRKDLFIIYNKAPLETKIYNVNMKSYIDDKVNFIPKVFFMRIK